MNFSEVNYSSYDNISLDGQVDSPRDQQVLAVVIYMMVFVVGVPGNTVVLWVTISEARQSVNAIWFLNLALADLLSCLTLPIHIMTVLMHGKWLLGKMACRILTSLFDFNLYASVLLLTTISADRFLIVFQPIWCQKYRVAWLSWLASGLAWILALVLTIPYFLVREFLEDSLSKKAFCDVTFGPGSPQVKVALTITLFVLSFLVPLVTMSICYTLLLLWTWRRPATRSSKTLKVVVAMVTSFFVFWMPYQVSSMLFVLLPRSWKRFSSLTMVLRALTYVNCFINPIIYVAAARGLHFRVFKFRLGRLRQLLTED